MGSIYRRKKKMKDGSYKEFPTYWIKYHQGGRSVRESTGTTKRDISSQIEQASEKLKESIEQAAERDALNQQITAKMKEMAELLEQVQSPEFREALKRMREALERMDRRPLEQQLPQWRDQNREMLENLERTLALLKLLRQEEKLESLAQRAEEMAKQ